MKQVWMSIMCGCVWCTSRKKSRRKLRKTYSSSERNQHQSSDYGDGRWDWRTSRCSVSRHNCQPSPKGRRFLKLEERIARDTANHHGNDRQSWKSQNISSSHHKTRAEANQMQTKQFKFMQYITPQDSRIEIKSQTKQFKLIQFQHHKTAGLKSNRKQNKSS